MTEQPPDYVIKPTISSVHKGILNFLPGWLVHIPQVRQDTFIQWGQNIANKDALAAGTVPVSGAGVTGAVQTNAIGIAPASAVAVSPTNMLVSQNFSSIDTVAVEDSNWSWDGSDGNITPGCARCECDGAQSDLVSNEIPVVVGENIEVSCQVKWENLDYTGTDPIVLGVERYRQGRDAETGGITYLDLGAAELTGPASIESPAADGDWGEGDLAGTYVVEAGVDLLRARFRPAPTIISGVVKWDEAVFLKLDLIDDAAVPGVGTTVDDIVTNLYGTEGDSFTHNDAAVALANTSAAITAINARLSAAEAGTSTGSIAGDDFLWSGEITTSANWGGAYLAAQPANGYYAANGADAVWNPSGFTPANTTQTCMFDWQGTDAVSATDYQLVQLLLSSAPATSHGFKSFIHLLARISSGFGSYDRAIIGSDGTYVVDYWNGSTFTVMDSGTCAVPGLGSLVSFYCGDKNSTAPRHFRLTADTTVIADFDEVGTGSPLGASNRKFGWGGKAFGGLYFALVTLLPAQGKPPKINQWLGYDQ